MDEFKGSHQDTMLFFSTDKSQGFKPIDPAASCAEVIMASGFKPQ